MSDLERLDSAVTSAVRDLESIASTARRVDVAVGDWVGEAVAALHDAQTRIEALAAARPEETTNGPR